MRCHRRIEILEIWQMIAWLEIFDVVLRDELNYTQCMPQCIVSYKYGWTRSFPFSVSLVSLRVGRKAIEGD